MTTMVGENRRGRSCELQRINFGTELKLMNKYSLKRKDVQRFVSLSTDCILVCL